MTARRIRLTPPPQQDVLGRVASRALQVLVLLSLTAGTALAGILGALLAVPFVAVVWTVATAWNPDAADEPAGALEVGPDRVLRRA